MTICLELQMMKQLKMQDKREELRNDVLDLSETIFSTIENLQMIHHLTIKPINLLRTALTLIIMLMI